MKNIIKTKYFIAGILLAFTHFICYFLGTQTIYLASDVKSDGSKSIVYPHFYNTSEALKFEREYCNAWIELTHYFLYDHNPANPGSELERNNYWLDVVCESDLCLKIDSLNGGNWEDFFCNWE